MSLQWYRPMPMGIDYSERCAHRYMGWIHNRGSHPAQPTHPFVTRAVPNIHLSCHLDCPNFYFVPTHAIKMCHATVRAEASACRGDASEPGQMQLISQSGRLSSPPPTRMLASTVRDKCGQSQAITGRAEEASELMTGRRAERRNTLSPTAVRQQRIQVFFPTPQVEANGTHGSLPLLFTPLSGSPQGATHHLSNSIYHSATI